jgi:hypothetical protein
MIGQQGLQKYAGNGGTFIARKDNDLFEPVIVAGGAAGTSNNVLMANGRTDQFGGTSHVDNKINKNIGSSAESDWKDAYARRAGFHVSPTL